MSLEGITQLDVDVGPATLGILAAVAIERRENQKMMEGTERTRRKWDLIQNDEIQIYYK